jgi:hypothetical protein
MGIVLAQLPDSISEVAALQGIFERDFRSRTRIDAPVPFLIDIEPNPTNDIFIAGDLHGQGIGNPSWLGRPVHAGPRVRVADREGLPLGAAQ